MIATPPYSKLNVDGCAGRDTAGNIRRIPFFCDLAFRCFYVRAKLCTRTLSRSRPRRHYGRVLLWCVTLRWMSVHRFEFVIRTRIKYVQTLLGATLRWAKSPHLLYSKFAGRIERWITTRST